MATLRPLLTTTGLVLAAMLCGEAQAEEPEPEPALIAAAQLRRDGPVSSTVTPYLTGASDPQDNGLQLRWTVRRGAADLGVGLGLSMPSPVSPPGLSGPLARPGVSLGWRGERGSALVYADAGQSRLQVGAPSALNTRVGVEWAPAKALPLGLDKGMLGMRLDSGYHLSLRPRRGGLALYVRGQF